MYFFLLPCQGETIRAENIALVETLIEPWFIFALIWSVGATCDGDGRKKFSEYMRKKMDDEKVIPKEISCSFQFAVSITMIFFNLVAEVWRFTSQGFRGVVVLHIDPAVKTLPLWNLYFNSLALNTTTVTRVRGIVMACYLLFQEPME